MAIRVMCDADHPDATKDEYWSTDDNPVYTRTYAEGCVVSLREMNGYNDSDFYATYYDEATETFKQVCYGSTRGWCYPNGAAVDATEEIRALWEDEQLRRDRSYRISQKLRLRREQNEAARAAGFTGRMDPLFRKLAKGLNNRADTEKVLKLLGSHRANRLRSNFKKSCADQVLRWLSDERPHYTRPLSNRQLNVLHRMG